MAELVEEGIVDSGVDGMRFLFVEIWPILIPIDGAVQEPKKFKLYDFTRTQQASLLHWTNFSWVPMYCLSQDNRSTLLRNGAHDPNPSFL